MNIYSYQLLLKKSNRIIINYVNQFPLLKNSAIICLIWNYKFYAS